MEPHFISEIRIVTRKKGLNVRETEDSAAPITGFLPLGSRIQCEIPQHESSKVFVTHLCSDLFGWIRVEKKRKGKKTPTTRKFLPPVSWRDVGQRLPGLPPDRIYRSGAWGKNINTIHGVSVTDSLDLGMPKCIVNLRPQKNCPVEHVKMIHLPAPCSVEERYDTSQKDVQNWLCRIVKMIEEEEIEFPVLFHCTHGRDRTGTVVLALLLIVGIELGKIQQDFLRTEGANDRMSLFMLAYKGITARGVDNYFRHFNRSPIDLVAVRNKILNKSLPA